MIFQKPMCFPTQKLYDEWRDCARIANELCTICDDCSGRYKHLMKVENKCRQGIWEQHIFGRKELYGQFA